MNVRNLMARVACSLTAGACLVVARISATIAAERDAAVGAMLAAIAAVGAAVALLVLAAAPPGFWRRVTGVATRTSVRMNRSIPAPQLAFGRILIISAAVVCIANFAHFRGLQQNPWDDDQGAYLQRAREIRSGGGLLQLLGNLVTGRFEEANRHPLYPALLSIRPDFESGKVLSASIGVLTLLIATCLVARRHGTVVAGLFSVFLSTNFAFCFFSTRVVSEVLIVLFSGIVWLVAVPRSVQEHSLRPVGEAEPGSCPRCASVGAILGLAWLAKATGLLLLIGYGIWLGLEFALRRRRDDVETSPVRHLVAALCLCAAFLAVGSPLLVRNVRRFGNPFYNVNSLLLFADSYDEFDGMAAAGTTTSAAAREYFETHSLGEMVSRETSGLVWELFIIVRSLGPTPLDDSRVIFGIPLALIAFVTMAARRRPEHRLLLVWGLLHWVVFAWYVPIAAGERFVLPLLIPTLVTVGEGMGQLWPWEKPWSARLLMGLALLWLGVWLAATYAGTSMLLSRLS